jgi:hypothetical protein
MTARFRHLRHRELNGLDRDRLDHTKDNLSSGNTPGRLAEYIFTADNTTNTIVVTGQDNLAVGNPVVVVYGTDLPLGLESGTRYWIADAGVDTYTLHSSLAEAMSGLTFVAFTDNGTGTHTLSFLQEKIDEYIASA